MEQGDKTLNRLKLATALRKILDRNKEQVVKHTVNDKESFWIVNSIRQLEATSGLSYTIVQGVFGAKRDIQFSSLMTIVSDGFGLTFSEFAEIFDSVTEEEIRAVKKHLASVSRVKKDAGKGGMTNVTLKKAARPPSKTATGSQQSTVVKTSPKSPKNLVSKKKKG